MLSKVMESKVARAFAAGLFILSTLTGCAPATSPDVSPVVTDVWIRAIPDVAKDGDMTGMFMTVANPGDTDIFLTGGTTAPTVSAEPLDAHEVVTNDAGEMVMQKTDHGILVPAHGSVQLAPGGFHIMFWKLAAPIAVGSTVPATLTFSNGTTVDVTAVAMTVEMGQEKYVAPGSEMEK